MKKDKSESVSIILPCAGHGTRLKLPYPKELIKINEEMSVIDYSFHHILASSVKPRVIVIIGPHKFDTARYLYEKYNDMVDLVFVFQKNEKKDIPNSIAIRSAEFLFGDKNILLMPDSIIEYNNKDVPLIDKMLEVLDSQSFVFAHKKESSKTRLKLFGALNIHNDRVIDYDDKPDENVADYNAFWVSFGFTKESFSESIEVLEKTTLKSENFKESFQNSSLYNSLTIGVTEYIDIGTWTNLNAHLLRQYLEKSGVDPQFLKIDSE